MSTTSVRETFTNALDALIEQVKQDRAILAAILCGSLAHDTAWSKSDIDLVLVTIDDRLIASGKLSLYADGVNVHAMLIPRAEFRKLADGAYRQSFGHSYLAKGRLLYTHDDTIAGLCAQMATLGERDTQRQILRAATRLLGTALEGAQVDDHACETSRTRASLARQEDIAGCRASHTGRFLVARMGRK